MARTRGSRRNPVTGSPRKRVGSIALARAKRDGRKETRTAQKKYDRSYRSRKLAKVKAQQARWYQKYGKKGIKAGTTRPTSKAVPKKKAAPKKIDAKTTKRAAAKGRLRKVEYGTGLTRTKKVRYEDPKTKLSPARRQEPKKTTPRGKKGPVKSSKAQPKLSKRDIRKSRIAAHRTKTRGLTTEKDIQITKVVKDKKTGAERKVQGKLVNKTPGTKQYRESIEATGRISKQKDIKAARAEIKAAQRPSKGEAGYRANRKPVPRKGVGTEGIDVKVAHAVSKRHPDPKNLSQINKERKAAGLPALKTNAEIRMSLHRAIEGGKVRVFDKPTKSGVGLLKASLSGATGGQASLKRGRETRRETTPGADLLINAQKVRREAYLPTENTYGEKLEALLRNRNLYARKHKKELSIAREGRKKTVFKQEQKKFDAEVLSTAKVEQRKLNKKIADPKTSSTSRNKAIQQLHQVQSDVPGIIRKNTTMATALAKKHGYNLKPAKASSLDDVLKKGARITSGQHKRLIAELDARYKANKPLLKGKANIKDLKTGVDRPTTLRDKYTKSKRLYDEQYNDIRRDLDHIAGVKKSSIKKSYLEDTPGLDQGTASGYSKSADEGRGGYVDFVTGDVPDLIFKKKGAIVDKRGRGAGGIKVSAEGGAALNLGRGAPKAVNKNAAKFVKSLGERRDKLNRTVTERVNEKGFKAGKVVNRNEADLYNPKDVRVIRGTDNNPQYVIRKGVDPQPTRRWSKQSPIQDNPLLKSARYGATEVRQNQWKGYTRINSKHKMPSQSGYKWTRITAEEARRLGPSKVILYSHRTSRKVIDRGEELIIHYAGPTGFYKKIKI